MLTKNYASEGGFSTYFLLLLIAVWSRNGNRKMVTWCINGPL